MFRLFSLTGNLISLKAAFVDLTDLLRRTLTASLHDKMVNTTYIASFFANRRSRLLRTNGK